MKDVYAKVAANLIEHGREHAVNFLQQNPTISYAQLTEACFNLSEFCLCNITMVRYDMAPQSLVSDFESVSSNTEEDPHPEPVKVGEKLSDENVRWFLRQFVEGKINISSLPECLEIKKPIVLFSEDQSIENIITKKIPQLSQFIRIIKAPKVEEVEDFLNRFESLKEDLLVEHDYIFFTNHTRKLKKEGKWIEGRYVATYRSLELLHAFMRLKQVKITYQ